MRKLVLGTGNGFNISEPEEIRLIADCGWDGVFTSWQPEDGNAALARTVKETGLTYQSVHAPFGHAHRLWEPGERGEAELSRQLACVRDCAKIGVPIVVMHAIIGMERHTPNALGVERFGKIFAEAKKLGVTVAVENTEGEEYLEAVLRAYADEKAAGFCIDTGHEACYNYGRDLIGKYADKLVCTHLNDNLGITGEQITWLDDAHLLPFDGTVDFAGVAARLAQAGYTGPLTFELTVQNKPERHTHDIYAHLDAKGFISLARERAKRFAALVEQLA